MKDAATKGDGFKQAMAAERQLKELQKVHKKAEYQSIKKIGELQDIAIIIIIIITL